MTVKPHTSTPLKLATETIHERKNPGLIGFEAYGGGELVGLAYAEVVGFHQSLRLRFVLKI